MPEPSGPLTGLKILDLSTIVAGGAASSMLADFGAQVVKVERPRTGDPLRNWGPFVDGVSLWWKVHSRNKQSVTLDLGRPEGQSLLKGPGRPSRPPHRGLPARCHGTLEPGAGVTSTPSIPAS